MTNPIRRHPCLPALVALCLALALTGCGNDHSAEQTPPPPVAPRVLALGLIPEQNLFQQKERYRPLAEYLSQHLGITVQLKILPRYGNIVRNFVAEGLDGAFLGSFTFTLLHKKLDIEPLVRPVNLDGGSTYYGLIFTRKDSGITSGREMQGKRFAFVDKATTAGYLLPLHYFKEQGIQDYQSWFKETYFTGTHADAIQDVLTKKADVGAAKNTVYYRLAQMDQRITDELLILAQSPEVPENGLAVRADLDPVLKLQIKKLLLAMDAELDGRLVLEQLGARRFIETHDQDYNAVYQYASDIGLDLASYEYLNN